MFEVVNDDFVLQIDDTFMTVAHVATVPLAGVPTSACYELRFGSIPLPPNVIGKPFFVAMTAYISTNGVTPRNVWRNGNSISFIAYTPADAALCSIYFFVPQDAAVTASNLGLQLFDGTGRLVYDAMTKTLNVVPPSAVPALLSRGRKLALLSRGLSYSANAIKGTSESRPLSYEFTATYALAPHGEVLVGQVGYIAPEYNGSYFGDNYVDIIAPPPLIIDVTNY